MQAINWINLWVLNELVCQPDGLSRLVYHPESDESLSHWAFPARDAYRAGPEARYGAICACVEAGWLCAYPMSWMTDRRITPSPKLALDRQAFRDPDYMNQTVVALTYEGHLKWEADFVPDWERFFSVSDHREAGSQEVTLHVDYAGNEILDDLIRWLPAYWDLDRTVPLVECNCYTVFQYRAAMWKVLEQVKSITLVGQDSEVRRIAAEELPPGLPDESMPAARERFRHRMQAREEEWSCAAQLLRQRSKRWECAEAPSPISRDAVPRMRSS